ncbi:MAG: cytochrome c family protein [Caulobacteraceae bacterium]
MSDLSTNKILAAVLVTGLVIVGLNAVIPEFFQKTPPTKPGYAIAVAPDLAGGGAAEVPDVPPDWGTVLKIADPAAGEAKTAACKSCHNFDPAGTNGIGPGLFGVLGRKPGSHPGFAYSAAMTAFSAKQPIWDFDHVYMFIAGPQKYLPGTKMTFIGLKQPQDRINVIAYLHTLGSSLPIPAPNPKKAAAVAPAAGAPASAKPGTPTPAVVPGKPGGPG